MAAAFNERSLQDRIMATFRHTHPRLRGASTLQEQLSHFSAPPSDLQLRRRLPCVYDCALFILIQASFQPDPQTYTPRVDRLCVLDEGGDVRC
jgi:hypothetical protein